MVTEKLNKYIIAKGISLYAFENSLGVSRGSISKAIKENKSIGSHVLENILNTYTDLNPDWLFTGRGSMLRDDAPSSQTPPEVVLSTSGEETIIYKLYKEEKEENKALIEEIGSLKERLRTYESESGDLGKDAKNVSTKGNLLTPNSSATSASVHLKK